MLRNALWSLVLVVGCGGQRADSARSGTPGDVGAGAGAGGALGSPDGTGESSEGRVIQLTIDEFNTITSSACEGWSVPPRNLPFQLDLLVDVSQSMGDIVSGINRTKWELALDVLLPLVTDALEDSVMVRLLTFPNRGVDTAISPERGSIARCVDFSTSVSAQQLGPRGSESRKRLSEELLGVTPFGKTPILDAYYYATSTQVTLPSSNLKRVLLVTDGMSTMNEGCADPNPNLGAQWPGPSDDDRAVADMEPIISAIARAHAIGTQTLVLGTPSSDTARVWLGKAAVAGGSAPSTCNPNSEAESCHIDMTRGSNVANQLLTQLQDWPTRPLDCTYDLDVTGYGQRPEPNKIAPIVMASDETLHLLTRHTGTLESCSKGYVLDCTKVRLCPDSCRLLNDDPAAELEILIGCSGGPLIIDKVESGNDRCF